MAVVVSNFRWSGGWYLRSRPTARVGSKFPPKCQFLSPNCNFFFTQGRFFGDAELTIFLKGSSLKGNLQISHLNHVRSCVEYTEDTRQLPLHSCQDWLPQPESKTISDHIGQVPPRAAWQCLLRPRLTNLDGLVHQVHQLDFDMLSIMTTTVNKFFSQSLDLSSKECAALEESVGGAEQLARITGSRAYERFRILPYNNNDENDQ